MAKKKDEVAEPKKKVANKKMVQAAIDAGKGTPGKGAIEWIAAEFGETITANTFNTTKSQLNKADGSSTPRTRTAKAGTSSAPTLVDLLAAKKLMDEVGMDGKQLGKLIDQLSAVGDLSKLQACLKGLEELAAE